MNSSSRLHPLEQRLHEQFPQDNIVRTVAWNLTGIYPALDVLSQVRERAEDDTPTSEDFYEVLREQTDFQIRINDTLSNIPAEWPVLITANHPYPILDGLALIEQARHARPDSLVKFIWNAATSLIPEMSGFAIATPEDKSDREQVIWFNDRVKEILDNDGIIAVFPRWIAAHEWPWKPWFKRMAQRSNAQIVPARVHSPKPSLWYQALKTLNTENAWSMNLTQALREWVTISTNFWEVITDLSHVNADTMKKTVYSL